AALRAQSTDRRAGTEPIKDNYGRPLACISNRHNQRQRTVVKFGLFDYDDLCGCVQRLPAGLLEVRITALNDEIQPFAPTGSNSLSQTTANYRRPKGPLGLRASLSTGGELL